MAKHTQKVTEVFMLDKNKISLLQETQFNYSDMFRSKIMGNVIPKH